MPEFIQKNIWDDFDILDYICITTNAITKSDGTLVMGAGIAKQASLKENQLKIVWGKQLREKSLVNKLYGLLSYNKYIAFQTKINWKNPSTLEIISYSVNKLKLLAEKYPDKIFGLAYPGINNGGLTKDMVKPLLLKLPNNVVIYYL